MITLNPAPSILSVKFNLMSTSPKFFWPIHLSCSACAAAAVDMHAMFRDEAVAVLDQKLISLGRAAAGTPGGILLRVITGKWVAAAGWRRLGD